MERPKKNQISAIPVIPTVCENCCYSVYYERERGFSEIPASLKKPNPRKRNNDKGLRGMLFFLYYERERVSVEIPQIKKKPNPRKFNNHVGFLKLLPFYLL